MVDVVIIGGGNFGRHFFEGLERQLVGNINGVDDDGKGKHEEDEVFDICGISKCIFFYFWNLHCHHMFSGFAQAIHEWMYRDLHVSFLHSCSYYLSPFHKQ